MIFGFAVLCMLSACGDAKDATSKEVRFSAFTLHKPAASLICRWIPTSSESVVISLPASVGDSRNACDYPLQIQLVGELPADAIFVGPVDPKTMIANGAEERIDLSKLTPMEAYALSWVGPNETQANGRLAAPFSATKPTGWHSCRQSCAVAFAYRGVAVRLLWNPEVHGKDAVEMTRRAYEILDAHSTVRDS